MDEKGALVEDSLTRPISVKTELLERITWLIKLRWLAIVGLLAAVAFSHFVLNIRFSPTPILLLTAFLGLYNSIFWSYARRIQERSLGEDVSRQTDTFANLQISIDIVSLTLLIHFSGGIDNPFIFYYVFHMIIASILLTQKATYFQATFAVLLFAAMVVLEYTGVVAHIHLDGFISEELHSNGMYVAGVLFVFVSCLYLSVYMATSITNKLREIDHELIAARNLAETRANRLAEANAKLEELYRAKSEFIRKVEHGLRAPLGVTQTCIKVVLGGITGELNEKQKDMLRRAEENSELLLNRVNDLLSYSQLEKENGKAALQPVDLKALIEKICRLAEPQADSKKLDLRVSISDDLPNLFAREEDMMELFDNLIGNAIKYTPEGGTVAVNAAQSEEDIIVEVSDTGIGIPDEDIPRLFDEFFRAKNARSYEKLGTGLGLSIVQKVVESCNGAISVDSKLGEGSRFTVTLPLTGKKEG